MPQLECEAVIFDMDGVLVDSEALNEKHWKTWAEKEGVSLEYIMSIHHGVPAAQTIATVAPHLNAKAEARWFEENLSTDLEGLLMFDGVQDVLTRLPDSLWAIATSAPQIIAFNRLRYLSLPIPAVIVTADDVQKGKPAPDPYLKAAQGLGKDPRNCLVIEDAPAGITAAKAAGAFVLAVPTTNKESVLQDADTIVPGFSSIRFEGYKRGVLVQW